MKSRRSGSGRWLHRRLSFSVNSSIHECRLINSVRIPLSRIPSSVLQIAETDMNISASLISVIQFYCMFRMHFSSIGFVLIWYMENIHSYMSVIWVFFRHPHMVWKCSLLMLHKTYSCSSSRGHHVSVSHGKGQVLSYLNYIFLSY